MIRQPEFPVELHYKGLQQTETRKAMKYTYWK